MLRVVTDESTREEPASMLDEICREGARRMLAAALETEADAYIAELVGDVDEALVLDSDGARRGEPRRQPQHHTRPHQEAGERRDERWNPEFGDDQRVQ